MLLLIISANLALAASEIERLTNYDMNTPNVTSYVERDFDTYTRSLRILQRLFQNDVQFHFSVPKDIPLKSVVFYFTV